MSYFAFFMSEKQNISSSFLEQYFHYWIESSKITISSFQQFKCVAVLPPGLHLFLVRKTQPFVPLSFCTNKLLFSLCLFLRFFLLPLVLSSLFLLLKCGDLLGHLHLRFSSCLDILSIFSNFFSFEISITHILGCLKFPYSVLFLCFKQKGLFFLALVPLYLTLDNVYCFVFEFTHHFFRSVHPTAHCILYILTSDIVVFIPRSLILVFFVYLWLHLT